jgi:hypothetical protein
MTVGGVRVLDGLVFGLLAVAGVAIVAVAGGLGIGAPAAPGSGLFPAAAGGVLTLAALATLAGRWRRARQLGDPAPARDTDEAAEIDEDGTHPVLKVGTVLALPLFYVLAVELAGHTVTTAVGAAVAVRLLGRRRWWWSALFGIGVAVGSQLVLSGLLGVSLPTASVSITIGGVTF